MRVLVSTSLFVLALGCQPQSELEFQHLSTMKAKTQGLVLMDDGQVGHAGMAGTTCRFDTLNGWLIDDFDLPTREERVLDTLRGKVLGTNDEGLYEVKALDFTPAEHVTEGRYLRGGELVWLQGEGASCSVAYSDGDVVPVSGTLCEAGPDAVSVVRDDGAVVVGTADETVVVDGSGAEHFADAADFVVYDPATGLVYLAQKGERTVRAVDLDGMPVWSTELPGRIQAMTRLGSRGKVVAMITTDDEDRMVVIDGPSGEQELGTETPSADVELEASEDGSTLAVVLPREIYFFDVVADGEEPKKRKTLGAEDQRPTFSD